MVDGSSKAGRGLGVTGEVVRENIRRLREDVRMPLTELSAKLDELGRPIPVLGIRRIESGERRVDVDDLVALAVALEVSPAALLIPDSSVPDERLAATAVGQLPARELLAWIIGRAPLPQQRSTANMHRTLPDWFIEEELANQRANIDWQVSLQGEKLATEALNSRLAKQLEVMALALDAVKETVAEVDARKRAEAIDDA